MQQRAGLLYLSKNTQKILLILENQQWTVPTFIRKNSLYEDAKELLNKFKHGKIVPIELYVSEDRKFEFSTYVCLTADEFNNNLIDTYAWCRFDNLPKQLHVGLKTTLNNKLIQIKIQTILELANADISN